MTLLPYLRLDEHSVANDGGGHSPSYGLGAAIEVEAVPADPRPRRLTPKVFLLLSTYDGAAFLPSQLESLMAQTHDHWVLYWRDDGSSDDTVAILEEFAALMGGERCVRVLGPPGRLGPAESFITLLHAVAPFLGPADGIAFADQDDVWLPDKLSRGIDALAAVDHEVPSLYCARLMVVDSRLQRLTETSIFAQRCGFPASLTQNVASGCTILLNRSAVALVAASMPPPASPHDWWCYLLISAAGGRILVDDMVVALYRQHRNNVFGARSSRLKRAAAAMRRGPGPFMNVLRQHVAALAAQPDLVSEAMRPAVWQLQSSLQGNFWRRLHILRLQGLHRQTRLETLLFRLWFLIG